MPTPQERTVATLKRARALVEERWFKGSYFGVQDGELKCCAIGAVGLATVAVERGEDELQAVIEKVVDAASAYAAAYDADAAIAAYAAADAAIAAYAADAAAIAAAADTKRSMRSRQRADGYRVGPILRECAGASIPTWNDAPERTKADVLKAFDCAIKKAEAVKGA